MSTDIDNSLQDEHPALGKRIITGGMILSVARVATKALTGISALIIPCWLGPTEMGIYGVALLALAAIDSFTQSGFVAAFIQRKTDYEKCILPVRTFNAFRGLVLGAFIFVAAPYIAAFMKEPRAADVIRILSLSPVLTGFIPMIWTLADKRLRFGYAAKYNVLMAALRLFVVLPLAWYLRTVWALVFGELILGFAGVVISTVMGREGRGFTLDWKPLRELRGFGFWIFLSSIAAYLYVQGGPWIIGRLLDVNTLAVYQLAFTCCTMITRETAGIINQMILPTFSHLQRDLPRLRSGFKKAFGVLAMIIIGTGSVCCVLSHDYFNIVLAKKWTEYAVLFDQLIPWFALWGVCAGLSGAQSGVIQALGKPKWWLMSLLVMCALMLSLIWPVFHSFGAVGIAALLGGIGALMQAGRYAIMSHMLKLRFLEVLEHVAIPLLAGIISVVLATLAREQLTSNVWGQAMVAGSVVTIAYVAILLIFSRYMNPNLIQLFGMILETLKEKTHRRA